MLNLDHEVVAPWRLGFGAGYAYASMSGESLNTKDNTGNKIVVFWGIPDRRVLIGQ